MAHHQMVADEWIARCGRRIFELLPALDTATAKERAKQILYDAYEYVPEDAAEIYAQELGPHDVDWERKRSGAWSVTFVPEGAGTDEEIAGAVAAAEAVLSSRGVSAHDGALAMFRLEGFHESGGDTRYQLTEKQDADLKVWLEAETAANVALNGGDARGRRHGHFGAVPPSMMRFRSAHRRWIESGVALYPQELTPSQPKALWLDRFAGRLGQLQPGVDATSAYQHAEATFPEAADLQPEDAADIFALEEPPREAGCPE